MTIETGPASGQFPAESEDVVAEPPSPAAQNGTAGAEKRIFGSGFLPRALTESRLWELFCFGFVGGVAFIVDVGLFNLLRFGPGELLEAKPLTAKVISVVVATLVSWVGNRYLTFSARRTENRIKELIGFGIVNVGGLLIALGCLWFSHYILEFTSPLADNISGNVVGLILGMVFRYFAYRHLVFTKKD